MPLRLVFIGRLEDLAGASERQVAAVASLEDLLAALEPPLAVALAGNRIKLALNGELVADSRGLRLADGDELAFLPPVSGG